MKIKASLTIGFPSTTREEEVEIDDEELAQCENDLAREKLINDCVQEWAFNYIETDWEEIEPTP